MRLYLTSKQIMFLVLPFVIIGYLHFSPNNNIWLINNFKSMFPSLTTEPQDYKKMLEESYKKGYFKKIDVIKTNFKEPQSLHKKDKFKTSWMIAYNYKQLPLIKVESVKDQTSGNKMEKMASLQKMVDKRNEDISSALDYGYKIDVTKDDISLINEIIRSRNLKKINIIAEEYEPINLKKYKLQMVLHSRKHPTVIINDKILKNYQYVDKYVKIIRIKNDKVLLQNKKEEKWLELNN